MVQLEFLFRFKDRRLILTFSYNLGLNYVPIMYIQNNVSNASQDYNDYQFSMGCGVLLSSVAIFVAYCLVEKNAPIMYPQAILPEFLAGILK